MITYTRILTPITTSNTISASNKISPIPITTFPSVVEKSSFPNRPKDDAVNIIAKEIEKYLQ